MKLIEYLPQLKLSWNDVHEVKKSKEPKTDHLPSASWGPQGRCFIYKNRWFLTHPATDCLLREIGIQKTSKLAKKRFAWLVHVSESIMWHPFVKCISLVFRKTERKENPPVWNIYHVVNRYTTLTRCKILKAKKAICFSEADANPPG